MSTMQKDPLRELTQQEERALQSWRNPPVSA